MPVKRDRDILSGLQITWTSPYKETAVFNNTVSGKIGIRINFDRAVYIPVETLLRIMNDLMADKQIKDFRNEEKHNDKN